MKRIFLIFVLVLLALLTPVTGKVTGCVTSFDLNATETINIQPGDSINFNATIWNVKCGITHTILTLDNISKEWYSVSPDYIASVAPFEAKSFSINLTLPEDVALGEYSGTYIVKTSEKWFRKHEFLISVNSKVEETVETEQISTIEIVKPIGQEELVEEKPEEVKTDKLEETIKEKSEKKVERTLIYISTGIIILLLLIFILKPKSKK